MNTPQNVLEDCESQGKEVGTGYKHSQQCWGASE